MTTRADILQPARDRTDIVRPKGGQQPRHHAPRGLTAGIHLGEPTNVRDLAQLTERAIKRLAANQDAENRRIGRFIDADGFYKDGVISNVKGEVIVPPTTENVATVLDKDTTQTEIVNTTTLTTIYNGLIPANIMGTNGFVELVMFSDYLNNSGAGRGMRFQVSLGGTVYMDYTTNTTFFGTSATRRVNSVCISLVNLGSRTSNLMRMQFDQTSVSIQGTATTGIGGFRTGVSGGDHGIGVEFLYGTLPISEDTGTDLNLTVKIAHSAAHASLSFRQHYSVLRRSS